MIRYADGALLLGYGPNELRPVTLYDNHSFKSCDTCILVVSEVSLYNKINSLASTDID